VAGIGVKRTLRLDESKKFEWLLSANSRHHYANLTGGQCSDLLGVILGSPVAISEAVATS